MSEQVDVGDGIEQANGDWEFDEEVAANFDSHVRKSIPFYDRIQRDVARISDWFVQGSSSDYVYDVGCATGETITQLAEHHGAGTEMQFIGIDEKSEMLDVADRKIPESVNYRLVHRDVTESPAFPNASLVISLFTLSFLPETDRSNVVQQVYDDLDAGGAFVFCEKTLAESGLFQNIWSEHYWDEKRNNSISADEVLNKARTLRGQLRPLSLSEYRRMLADAGFDGNDVGVFFKFYPWTGVIARKSL